MTAREQPRAADAAPAEPADRQLDGFLDRYAPEIAALSRRLHAAMRRRLPGAVEMVYDNYNALVIGFGPSERASDAIFSIVMYPRYVSLCFLQGASVPDPDGLLQGSGNVVRHIRLPDVATLARPEVEALVARALLHARVPIDPSSPGRLVIKSISAKQRPRRPS